MKCVNPLPGIFLMMNDFLWEPNECLVSASKSPLVIMQLLKCYVRRHFRKHYALVILDNKISIRWDTRSLFFYQIQLKLSTCLLTAPIYRNATYPALVGLFTAGVSFKGPSQQKISVKHYPPLTPPPLGVNQSRKPPKKKNPAQKS